jgi:beta-lactamase class A
VIAADPVARLQDHPPELVRLAEEVSLAVVVDPVLLRRARLDLAPAATAATEADLWFSPLVRSRSPDGFVFTPDAAAALRARLAADPDRLQAARDRVEAAHAHLPPALQVEEELLWLSCRQDAAARERCEELLRSVVAALVRDGRAGVASWAARALPPVVRMVHASEAGRMLEAGVWLRMGRGFARFATEDGTPLPEWLHSVAPPDLERATLRVRLLPTGIEVDAGEGAGGHAIAVPATYPLLLDVTWPGATLATRRVALRPGQAAAVPGDASRGVRLRTIIGELYDLRPQPVAPPPQVTPSRGVRKRSPDSRAADPLGTTIREIAERAGARSVSVAWHDYETHTSWSYRGEEWYHAASMVALPVMLGVFRAIEEGRFGLLARVHVRNRFSSAADGSPFRVERSADAEVHAALGKTLRVQELLHHMIAVSSDLATNLLIDLVGADAIARTLRDLKLDHGVEFRRGVEDEAAHEAGINNRCTADGMLELLRTIEERKAFSEESSRLMLEVLHAQEFRGGIPARLPKGLRVAHKTGDISTVAHDAGIVYLPKRKPYVLVVLTEWAAARTSGRRDTIARISEAVFHHLPRFDE